MSCAENQSFPTGSRVNPNFHRVVAEALRRRLHPNTGLHPAQLAYALGVNGETIRTWLRGHACPNGAAIDALLRFFYYAGDHGFAVELFGSAITPLARKAKVVKALEALDQARAALLSEEAA